MRHKKNNNTGKNNMKQEIINKWKSEITQHWVKILCISTLATCIFLSFSTILFVENVSNLNPIPKDWIKIELTLQGNYLAEIGEWISVLDTQGTVVIHQARLLKISKNENSSIDNLHNNLWNVQIALAPINYQKLKLLNLKKPEELYLSPKINFPISNIKKVAKERTAYEINY
jgi:hypothetical protein